jgi:hypothetical protein
MGDASRRTRVVLFALAGALVVSLGASAIVGIAW